MHKSALAYLALAVLSSTASAQNVIENPAKPSSRNAGRVVSMKEEMRIEDTGEGFFFKAPRGIRVSPKGDIFIEDGQGQVLQFDPQGHFVRNLFKKGQGPGELLSVNDIWVSSDRLYLLGYPQKILIYDYSGNLLKEVSPKVIGGFARFIFADTRGFLFQIEGYPDTSAGTGLKDIPRNIIELTPDGASLRTVGSFTIPGYLKFNRAGGSEVTTWNQLLVVALDGNSLFLNYTPEYLVENSVRDKGAVVRQFKRPYKRVKWSGGGGISMPGDNAPSPPEFLPDIHALHVVDGKIWVQTSTVVEGKGILVDVFDLEGRYVDNFFIQSLMKDPSGKPANMRLTIAGGFAYFKDKTEDELIVIKKCRLVGL
ncbi:MAG: 6-bladed beta-propeller [Candidatus Aminicenantes bacterium]|nr:6-bladed beta-propeller [Candidatus Aminicenantes bacterium]